MNLKLHCACRLYNMNCIREVHSKLNLSCIINGNHMYTFLIMYLTCHLSSQKYNSSSVFVCIVDDAHCMCQINNYSVCNLCCFIHHGMVHCTCLIQSDHNLRCIIVCGMVDHTRLIWSDRSVYCSFFMTWLSVPA